MGKSAFEITFNAVQTQNEALNRITEALKVADSLEVLVGVTNDTTGRDDDSTGINNAELLYIHTYGSPVNNIPARDVLESSMSHNKDQVSILMEAVLQAALAGDVNGVHKALEKAGMQGQNIARGWFTDPANGWAPNTPETIKAKSKNGKGAKDKPLIDSGEMRKAIAYAVREKGKTK